MAYAVIFSRNDNNSLLNEITLLQKQPNRSDNIDTNVSTKIGRFFNVVFCLGFNAEFYLFMPEMYLFNQN